jgi:hypothetical protein
MSRNTGCMAVHTRVLRNIFWTLIIASYNGCTCQSVVPYQLLWTLAAGILCVPPAAGLTSTL